MMHAFPSWERSRLSRSMGCARRARCGRGFPRDPRPPDRIYGMPVRRPEFVVYCLCCGGRGVTSGRRGKTDFPRGKGALVAPHPCGHGKGRMKVREASRFSCDASEEASVSRPADVWKGAQAHRETLYVVRPQEDVLKERGKQRC